MTRPDAEIQRAIGLISYRVLMAINPEASAALTGMLLALKWAKGDEADQSLFDPDECRAKYGESIYPKHLERHGGAQW